MALSHGLPPPKLHLSALREEGLPRLCEIIVTRRMLKGHTRSLSKWPAASQSGTSEVSALEFDLGVTAKLHELTKGGRGREAGGSVLQSRVRSMSAFQAPGGTQPSVAGQMALGSRGPLQEAKPPQPAQ